MFTNPLPDTPAVADRYEEVRDDFNDFEQIALKADLSEYPSPRTEAQHFELHLEKSGFIHVRPPGTPPENMASIAIFDISQLSGVKGRNRHGESMHSQNRSTRDQALEYVDPLNRWCRFAERALNSGTLSPMADTWIDDDLPVRVPEELQFAPYQL